MALGILGRKLGMTQVFSAEGMAIPVTVVEAGPCVVTQIKTVATDGYNAIQIGFGAIKPKNVSKPAQGHFNKSGIEAPVRHLKEFRVDDPSAFSLGQEITADLFSVDQVIDVAGMTIGRGFAGYQKRHNFKRGPMAHGSKNHRLPGSTGAGTTPGRVFPGKRMAGRYGNSRVTIKKLQVVRVDATKNLILIKGAIPGVEGGLIEITPTNVVGRVKA